MKTKLNSTDKVKLIDCHWSKPLFLYADEASNISVYDCYQNNFIVSFNLSKLLEDKLTIRHIKFFRIDEEDKRNIVDLNEIKKNSGLPYFLRQALIIVTTQKNILFISLFSKTVIKSIEFGTNKDIESKPAKMCDIYNHLYVVILTEKQEIIVFNIVDWKVTKVLSKKELNKGANSFFISQICQKQVVISLSDCTLISLKINNFQFSLGNLDSSESYHDNDILDYTFNEANRSIVTVSKNMILLSRPEFCKSYANFQYHKSDKITNICKIEASCFSEQSYLVSGKNNYLALLVLDEDNSQSKIESKRMKDKILLKFELNAIDSTLEKDLKIYCMQLVRGTDVHVVLGTNHGALIIEVKNEIKSNKVLCEDNAIFSILENNLIKETFGSSPEFEVINQKALISNLIRDKSWLGQTHVFNNTELFISADRIYFAAVDKINKQFAIYKDDFEYLTSGLCSDFVWCPYDRMFATSKQFSDTVHKANSMTTAVFELKVYKINDYGKAEVLYVIEGLSAHRLFGTHFVSCFQKSEKHRLTKSSNFEYCTPMIELSSFNWEDGSKVKWELKEEPLQMETSSDLCFLAVRSAKNIIVYSYEDAGLQLKTKLTLKASDIKIVHSCCLIVLTQKGVYLSVLCGNPQPIKLIEPSAFFNEYNMEIAKNYGNIDRIRSSCDSIVGIHATNVLVNIDSEVRALACKHPIIQVLHEFLNDNFEEITSLIAKTDSKYMGNILSLLKYLTNKVTW